MIPIPVKDFTVTRKGDRVVITPTPDARPGRVEMWDPPKTEKSHFLDGFRGLVALKETQTMEAPPSAPVMLLFKPQMGEGYGDAEYMVTVPPPLTQ